MAIQSAEEKVEMAIFDFESAVESAAHDMSGWAERAELKQARADLKAALTARDAAIRAEEKDRIMRVVNRLWQALGAAVPEEHRDAVVKAGLAEARAAYNAPEPAQSHAPAHPPSEMAEAVAKSLSEYTDCFVSYEYASDLIRTMFAHIDRAAMTSEIEQGPQGRSTDTLLDAVLNAARDAALPGDA